MTIAEIKAMTFEGEAKEVVDFLLEEVFRARRSAIGYGRLCIAEGLCEEEECEDVTEWEEEATEAGWPLE
jgi:hypothetical protein